MHNLDIQMRSCKPCIVMHVMENILVVLAHWLSCMVLNGEPTCR